MRLKELRELTMFQLGLEAEDARDFEPHLTEYLNEGYEELARAADEGLMEEYQPMSRDHHEPELLEECDHRAVADWATWRVCLRGNAIRQRRGEVFLQNFERTRNKLLMKRGGSFRNWRNL